MTTPIAVDRQGVAVWRLVPVVLATAASVGLAAQTVPAPGRTPTFGLGVGVVVAAMAVLLLRSIPIRWAVGFVVVLGAGVLVRYGVFGTVVDAPIRILGWSAATGAALVMGARFDLERRPPLGPMSGRPASGQRRAAGVVGQVVIVASLLAAAGLTLGPVAATNFAKSATSGEPPELGDRVAGNSLVATDRLDMTARPRLGNTVLMTVTASKSSFWRTAVFDVWDGSAWSRSRAGVSLVVDGDVVADPSDLGATTGATLRQRVRIESRYAEVLPAAPSPVSVSSDQRLVQYADGSLVVGVRAMGPGTTYTVVSRQVGVTEAALRGLAQTSIPEDIARRYASAPRTTARVRDLARSITAGATTDYDKVQAIERWMGEHTTYSLNAPLAPSGVDVVDHFLFTSKVGWCEQIASSLAVMLRSAGVPTRLATGYVPGDWDPVTASYRVRERDAHAWTEVWFPSVGWVPFDPTADVPLAGDAASSPDAGWIWEHLSLLLVVIAIATSLVRPVARGVRSVLRWIGRRSLRRRDRRGWIAEAEHRLERLGEADGRSRAPYETATTLGYDLAERWGDPRALVLGERLDQAIYSASEPTDADRREVERALEELAGSR